MHSGGMARSKMQGSMMRRREINVQWWLFVFVALFSNISSAKDITVTGSMSTLGPSIQFSMPYNDVVNFRFLVAGYRYTTEDNLDDIRYSAKFTLSGAGVLADWHPFGSGFHVSLGLFRTSNRFDGKSIGASEYIIGNNTYSAAEVANVRAKADLGSGAPYTGMGWGYSMGSTGWGFAVEAGVVYQPTPAATVNVAPGAELSGVLNSAQQARLALLQQDEKVEAKNLEDAFDTFKAFPVVSAGVTYTF